MNTIVSYVKAIGALLAGLALGLQIAVADPKQPSAPVERVHFIINLRDVFVGVRKDGSGRIWLLNENIPHGREFAAGTFPFEEFAMRFADELETFRPTKYAITSPEENKGRGCIIEFRHLTNSTGDLIRDAMIAKLKEEHTKSSMALLDIIQKEDERAEETCRNALLKLEANK